MKKGKRNNIVRNVLVILIIIITNNSFSQRYFFRNFNQDQGLDQLYIYAITQNKNGNLNLSTGDGFVSFDGTKFKSFKTTDGLAENFATTHFQSSDGKIWIGHFQGGLSVSSKSRFTPIGTAVLKDIVVNKIIEDDKKNIIIATSGKGIVVVDSNLKVYQLKNINSEIVTDVAFYNNDLILATDAGAEVYSYTNNQNVNVNYLGNIACTKETPINCIAIFNNSLVVGTNGQGIFFIKKKKLEYEVIQNIKSELISSDNNVTTICANNKTNIIWVALNEDGVRRITFSKNFVDSYSINSFFQKNGLASNTIKAIYIDTENTTWFGTFSGGLSQLVNERFINLSNYTGTNFSNILSIAIDSKSTFWLGTPQGLIQYTNGTEIGVKTNSPKEIYLNKEIVSLYIEEDNLWIGTANDGIYCYNLITKKLNNTSAEFNLKKIAINTITSNQNDLVYFGSDDGLYIFNKQKKTFLRLTTNEGLPHNVIKHLYFDSSKKLWFASPGSGLYYYDKGAFTLFKEIAGFKSFKINSITEGKKNQIWFATEGDGVFCYDTTDFKNYKVDNGLGSNYCQFVFYDKNKIWVGHKNGLSAQKDTATFDFYTKKDGLDAVSFNLNSYSKSSTNTFLLGTTNGLVLYDPTNDKPNTILPPISLVTAEINDKLYPADSTLFFAYDKYAVEFTFNAVCLKDPSRVKYKYMLKGFETKWKTVNYTNISANYPKIEDGEYEFILSSCNDNGKWTEDKMLFKFKVDIPFWKNLYFYIVLFLFLFVLAFLVHKRRTKALTKRNKHLEETVNDRTMQLQIRNKELDMAKHEVEEKNRDITDSINYAKRIQDAVLSKANTPDESTKLIRENSFIYYKPRDIVSGDFYWFHKIDTKIIIAIADGTGHGVPGAFMSMIGISLLNQVVVQNNILNPCEIIKEIDKAVIKILKPEEGGTHDGMEMAICAIDLGKKTLLYSGAKRPLYMVRDNQLYEKSPSKFSVGGAKTEKEKEFSVTEIALKPDDSFYIFSDGYVDQFGGKKNKRFTSRRFKDLLVAVGNLKINEQEKNIASTILSWQDNYAQTDDILVMGLKI